jgi:hypothetical protein
MKARDIFGILIRVCGLLSLLYSMYYFAWALAAALSKEGERVVMYLPQALPFFGCGVVLMGFARYIVRLCYPNNRDDSED